METSNPAERLFNLLSKVNSSQTNQKTYTIWEDALDIDENSKVETFVEIYRRLSHLADMLDGIEFYLVEESLPNEDVYQNTFRHIRSVLAPANLEVNWSEYAKILTDERMRVMKMCSNDFGDIYTDQLVDEQDLDQLDQEVSQLIERITGAQYQLDPQLERIMLRALSSIRRAIDEYRIEGVDALRRAYFSASGELNFHADQIQETMQSSSEAERDFRDLIQLFVQLAAILVQSNHPELSIAATAVAESLNYLIGRITPAGIEISVQPDEIREGLPHPRQENGNDE